jgi:hypothetical protein
MYHAEDSQLVRGRKSLDHSILQYLRRMISISKRKRRQDMQSYYEAAWEFSTDKIYGAFPPRAVDLYGKQFYKPSNPEVPSGFRPVKTSWPLRKIVKINHHPEGYGSAAWEMLECYHELRAFPGYSNPVKSRRCIYCAFVEAQKLSAAKKRPASAPGVPIAKAKAVGA